MTETSFDTWAGAGGTVRFGSNGTDAVTYGLIRSPGLDDRSFTSDNLGGGFDGLADVVAYAQAGSWVTEVDLAASTASAFETLRNNLRAATADGGVGTYTISRRNDTWTVFARVTERSIPRDRDSDVGHYAVASIGFRATDPYAYSAVTTASFTGDDATIDSDGWSDSYRWKWVVPGPVTNPTLSSTVGTGAAIRYVGTVASGSNLVVELFPRGCVPGYIAKVVTNAQLATYATSGVGTSAYGALDGGPTGSARPPQWFPISPGEQTVTSTETCTFTYREAFG